MTRMHVLVVGGTRFFGKTLVEQLASAGHRVTVLSRGKLSAPAGAEHLAADRADPAALSAALAGRSFDAVVDNVASNAEHVGAALDAIGDRAGHYVLTSTLGAYGDFDHGLFFREIDLDGAALERPSVDQHPYTLGKRAAELVLWKGERSKVPFTIVRPGYVIGPHDHLKRMQFFVRRVRDGGPVVVPSGASEIFQLAWHADVAAAIARVLGDRERFGRAYNLAGIELFTYPSLVRMLAALAGVKTRCVEVPRAMLRRGVLAKQELPFGEEGWSWACDTWRQEREIGLVSTKPEVWMKELLRAPLGESTAEEDAQRAAEIRIARKAMRPVSGAPSRLRR
jgi:nucleoside-diphosphate-sugar epimerase